MRSKTREKLKTEKAITLVALVVTIIILLILAGVTIGTITGNGGLLGRAKNAANIYKKSTENEQQELDEFDKLLENNGGAVADGSWSKSKLVNTPKIMTGMTPIKFEDPTDTVEGKAVTTKVSDTDWYDYSNKKWANAQTEDGSMWVWIPRFEYKLDSANQKTDVKFIPTSQTKADDGYIIEPAFVNESSINYKNGGWDSELSGFWVAKFEAGYANSDNGVLKDSRNNNSAPIKASSVNYTKTTVWVAAVEIGTSSGGAYPARNWLDGTYGETTTKIKYPTFQGLTYSMNYINHNDAYNISKAISESGNIYGLSTSTDSHLMKNSEWGAIAYLAQSQYGLGTNIYINNANLNNTTTSVYAVTGCSAKTIADDAQVLTTIDQINNRTANLNVWTQKAGQKSSSSGTIYGIYDLSGGNWERIAAYVNNGNSNLTTNGASVVSGGATSTKYATVYPSTEVGSTDDLRSQANYEANKEIYGDAIRETSTAGTGKTSWYSDYSHFPENSSPFFLRGGGFWNGSGAGLFFFYRYNGNNHADNGFRAILV